jgi:hypothetical protein
LTATTVLRDAAGRVAGILARTADGEHLRPRAASSQRTTCAPGWPAGSAPPLWTRSRPRRRSSTATSAMCPSSASTFTFRGGVRRVVRTHGGEAWVWRCRPTPAPDSLGGAGATAPPHRSSSSTPSLPTSPPGSARPPHHVRHTP